MISDSIIIGQEVLFWDNGHRALGRVDSYSAWEGVVDYIVIKQYDSTEKINRKPDSVDLIDPRPFWLRLHDLFRFVPRGAYSRHNAA